MELGDDPPRYDLPSPRRYVDIVLSWREVSIAASIGAQRQMHALRSGRKNRHGMQDDPHGEWGKHIEGVCGEMATAQALGVYYNPTVNTFKVGGDVGANIQVRTRSLDHYELIIRSDDSDGDVFVLVTGRAPSFRVHGWIGGGAAKQQCWLKGHGGREPAWFVPQLSLSEIDTLLCG